MHFVVSACTVVQVNWTISEAISVTEGDVVRLSAEVFGRYAIVIAIGVDCTGTLATNVKPGMDTVSMILEMTLRLTQQSWSLQLHKVLTSILQLESFTLLMWEPYRVAQLTKW